MKTYSGVALVALAIAVLFLNVSDRVADLQNWHDASTPQFVGMFIKQIGASIIAAVGGNLLPSPGKS